MTSNIVMAIMRTICEFRNRTSACQLKRFHNRPDIIVILKAFLRSCKCARKAGYSSKTEDQNWDHYRFCFSLSYACSFQDTILRYDATFCLWVSSEKWWCRLWGYIQSLKLHRSSHQVSTLPFFIIIITSRYNIFKIAMPTSKPQENEMISQHQRIFLSYS